MPRLRLPGRNVHLPTCVIHAHHRVMVAQTSQESNGPSGSIQTWASQMGEPSNGRVRVGVRRQWRAGLRLVFPLRGCTWHHTAPRPQRDAMAMHRLRVGTTCDACARPCDLTRGGGGGGRRAGQRPWAHSGGAAGGAAGEVAELPRERVSYQDGRCLGWTAGAGYHHDCYAARQHAGPPLLGAIASNGCVK